MDILYCGTKEVLVSEKCYTWNSLRFSKESPKRIFDESTIAIQWKKERGYCFPYVTTTLQGKDYDGDKNCVHVLMSSHQMDEKWCFPVLKKYISALDRVCILALSFYEDTKTISDWNKQYKEGQGIEYRENTDVFFRYGITKDRITWVNYFLDTRQEIENKLMNSSVVLLPGGAPDRMMKRIKQLSLKRALKNYRGVMIGYSAGAMVQLDQYHLTPDDIYNEFKYETGLGCLSGFDVECHYRGSNIQKNSIQRVQEEKQVPIYAIKEQGGICIHDQKIFFGDVERYD